MSVVCDCVPGYTGPDCSLDEDGCLTNPCYTGVRCADVAVNDLADHPKGFLCADCPDGLEGDGQTCVGVYENSIFNFQLRYQQLLN